MSPTSSNSNRWFSLLAVAGVIVAMGFNLYVANHVSVVLPQVDGWAVWDRAILFNSGAINWADYLFTPHGAHLHSIIYLIAWFDYLLSDADQQLMRFFSLSAVTIFASTVSWLIWKWGAINQRPLWLRVLTSISTAALLTSVIDQETLLQPFQAVLSVSRLFYFLLLAGIVIGLVYRKSRLYVASVGLSMVAVSFHGSGYIFAILIVLAHLLLTRKPTLLIVSVLPLGAVFAFQKIFSNGGGELSQLDKVLVPRAAFVFVQSASAYFAMPFNSLRAVLGDFGLVTLGFFMMLTTAVLTFVAFLAVLRQAKKLAVFREMETQPGFEDLLRISIHTLSFLTGLFLLLSAAAAASFWIIRTSDPGHLPAYMEVLVATRYTAYSTLALIMVLGYVLTINRLSITIGIAIASAILLMLAIWPAASINRTYLVDDQLNRAAAALSIGISPLHPEADVVWPQANKDWYWSTNLPKTVAQLRLDQKSIWKYLPPLGAVIDGSLFPLPLALTRIRQIESVPGKCGIEGTLPIVRSHEAASSMVLLVSDTRQVIGYAVRMRHRFSLEGRRIDGFFMCQSESNVMHAIFLAEVPVRWHVAQDNVGLLESPENLTDKTWLNGVARGWSGFFVSKSPKALETYVSGAILRMADGRLKVVTKTESNGNYLNVFLDGAPIDGNVNGYPHRIEIIR